jgi:hypothetical protein
MSDTKLASSLASLLPKIRVVAVVAMSRSDIPIKNHSPGGARRTQYVAFYLMMYLGLNFGQL